MVSRAARTNVDRGWCWVIAASCCWITFVTQGLLRCGGVVFVSVIDAFHITRGQASWPFTLRIAVWNLSGPVIGALSFYWTTRTITAVGVLILTLGNVLCWFATDVTTVVLFLGVLQGLGTGMAVTLVPLIINQYFVKYKTTGMGIACAGATVGSFALPPLLEFLLEEYGLAGGFLLMGAITLQGLIGASFLRPAEWLRPLKTPPTASKSLRTSAPSRDGNTAAVHNGDAKLQLALVNASDEGCGEKKAKPAARNSDVCGVARDDVDETTGLTRLEEEDEKGPRPREVGRGSGQGDECKERSWGLFLSAVRGVAPHVKMASAIVTNPYFLVTAFNFGVLFLSYMTYLTIVVDFALDHSVPPVDAVFLVSSFSIADLCGRMGFGWLTDKKFIRRRNLLAVNMTLLGTLFAVSPVVLQYTAMMALTVVMGTIVGISLVATYPLLEEYIGLARLPLAIGLMNFINGCISFVAPVITGVFRDKLGSYDHLFHFLGAMCIIGGLLWVVDHVIHLCRRMWIKHGLMKAECPETEWK